MQQQPNLNKQVLKQLLQLKEHYREVLDPESPVRKESPARKENPESPARKENPVNKENPESPANNFKKRYLNIC